VACGYINPASGNLFYTATDVSVSSPMGIEFTRGYNSQADYTSPLGKGWDHDYNIALFIEYDDNQNEIGAILKMSSGNMYKFTKNRGWHIHKTKWVVCAIIYDR